MTGLLEEYGVAVDLNEIADGPNYEVEDGIYEFEIGDVFVKEGTDKYPDRKWIVIEYLLGGDDGEGKKKSDWFQLPEDAEAPTAPELVKLGFYKQRLRDLGIPAERLNKVGRDDLVGLTGSLSIKTTKSKKDGKMYQNVSNVRLMVTEDAPVAKAPAAAKKAPAKTGAAKNPFAK